MVLATINHMKRYYDKNVIFFSNPAVVLTLSLAARQEKNFQSCKESLVSSLDLQISKKICNPSLLSKVYLV
jgi:hypothetical protein